ncbi:MAG: ATP synthase subunit C [Treponema sp.]|nr:ATP synthase subunit C [Treponema sp.]
MKKRIFSVLAVFAVCAAALFAQDAEPAEAAATTVSLVGGLKYLAAALSVGLACIGGGLAVAKIGSAAMGAMSEKPELSGKALPFVGLAEGICLWGMLVGVLILVM